MYKALTLYLLMVLGVFISGNAMASEDKLSVFVSIAPQKYMVQQIGKDLLDIHIMVHPGASPATYEPRPRQMVALAEADLYFSIGVLFEKVWLKKIAAANPRMRVVATEQGIEKRPVAAGHRHEHDHPVDENNPARESVPDPHIWTSPPLVLQQARTILGALQQIDPIHRMDYAANLIAKAIGTKVIVADPLAADWAANLRRQAAQFKAAMR